MNSNIVKRLLQWEFIYLFFALIFGLYFAFRLPPLQIMDEERHFQKAYAFSEGYFFCSEGEQKGQYGMYLPKEIAHVGQTFGVDPLINRIDVRIPEKTIAENSKKTVGTEREFTNQPFCTRTLWTVLPQSFGIFIAKLFTSEIGVLLYAGRVANLLFAILVMFFAIRITPLAKGVFTFTGLLPMFVQQTASLSADAMHYVGLLFFTAVILYFYYKREKKISLTEGILFFLISLLCIHAKAGYYPFALLVLLIPETLFASKKSSILYKILFIIGHILFAICYFLLIKFNTQVIDQKSQLLVFFVNPFDFFKDLFFSINVYFDYYWKSLLGGLGTKELYLNNLHYILLLGGFIVLAKEETKPLSAKFSLISLLTLLGCICTIFLGLSILEPRSGNVIDLVQGKYFLPLLPLAFLLLYHTVINEYGRKILIVSIIIISILASFSLIEQRYYSVEEKVYVSQTADSIPYALEKQKPLEQTFISDQKNLSGLGFFIDKSSPKITSTYQFLLKEGDCRKILFAAPLMPEQLLPGKYYEVYFPVISSSKDTPYCFEVFPTISSTSPLRISAAKNNVYSSGALMTTRKETTNDLIFYAIYEK
ncbi:MAG: DUF2142 domain-containing protein [Candidatus Gracilibacteria bacterium]